MRRKAFKLTAIILATVMALCTNASSIYAFDTDADFVIDNVVSDDENNDLAEVTEIDEDNSTVQDVLTEETIPEEVEDELFSTDKYKRVVFTPLYGWDEEDTKSVKMCDITSGNTYGFWLEDEAGESKPINSKELLENALSGIAGTSVSVSTDKISCKLLKGDSAETAIEVTDGSGPIIIEKSGDVKFKITKNSSFSREDTDKYFISLTVDYPDYITSCTVTPLLVNEPNVICDTKEEAYQAVRDIIRNRTNNMSFYRAENYRNYDTDGYIYDRIYVKKDTFREGYISLIDTCDFEAEREGMKPYEGDYMYNLIGNRIQRSFYYEDPRSADQNDIGFGTLSDNDNDYVIYEVYLPVITTLEEENAVDAKVSELMNSTFASVKNGSKEEKIKAVYDYIRGNVKGTVSGAGGSDRTYPLYHTAYHALIKGNGTCEAFAQLFTRLTRELGVPSKVIMGVDANNHTYNIVDRGDGYWYFIDTNTGRYLTDSSFSRTKEQERYTTAKYIMSYWARIKGGTTYQAEDIKVLSQNVLMYASNDPEEIHDYIVDRLKDDPEAEYVIKLESDWTIEHENYSFDFSSCYIGTGDPYQSEYKDFTPNVSMDLGGHTLTCKNDNGLFVGSILNGTIKVGRKAGDVSYSGNARIAIPNIKNVTFTGVTGSDKVLFRPESCKSFELDDVYFKNVVVTLAPDVFVEENKIDYELKLVNDITLENCGLYIYDHKTKGHPVIITKVCDDLGNTVSEGRLILKGTTTLGKVDGYNGESGVFDGNHVFVQKPIEFAVQNGKFVSGDCIVKSAGTIKKYTENKKTTNAEIWDLVDRELTKAYQAEGDESELKTVSTGVAFVEACTVICDANGTSELPANIDNSAEVQLEDKLSNGDIYPKDLPTPVREGFDFDGWYTEKEGGTKIVGGSTKFSGIGGTVRIYAHWKPYSYTIRFHSNLAKDTTKTQSMVVGTEKALNTKVFTNKGYRFTGWTTQKDGTGASYSEGQTVSNLTLTKGGTVELYANWKALDYVIFFDADGGEDGTLSKGKSSLMGLNESELEEMGIDLSSINTESGYLQAAKYNEELTLTGTEFYKKGYTLTGWYNPTTKKTIKNGTIKALTVNPEVVILKAIWKKDTYKVGYVLNKGTLSKSYTKKTDYSISDGKILLPTADEITKKGYDFKGWFDNKNYEGSPYTYLGPENVSDNAVNQNDVLRNISLYAKFEPIEYKIKFIGNGGKISGDYETEKVVTVKYDQLYTLPSDIFERDGHTFSSWNTGSDSKGTNYTKGKTVKNLTDTSGEEIKLYAIWTRNTYKIIYQLDGGKNVNNVINETKYKAPSGYNIDDGCIITIPQKTGYTFDGWEIVSCDGKIDDSDMESKYGVSFLKYDSDTQKALTSGSYGKITLKAHWVDNKYKLSVKYEDNFYDVEKAGTDSAIYNYNDVIRMSDVAAYIGTLTDDESELVIPDASKITKFTTQPNGKGTKYDIKSAYTKLITGSPTDTDDDDLTGVVLYPVFGQNENYTIDYVLNGGTIKKPTYSYDSTKATTLPNPLKTGYVFDGWMVDNTTPDTVITTSSKNTTRIEKGSSGNIKVEATYSPIEYTVLIDPNAKNATFTDNALNNNGIAEKKTLEGKKKYNSTEVLPVLSRPGYEFKGYYLNKNGKGDAFTTTGGLSNKANAKVTLYAVWTAIEYKLIYEQKLAEEGAVVTSGKSTLALPAESIITPNSKYGLLKASKTGYTFNGWLMADGDSENNINTDDKQVVYKRNTEYVTDVNALNACNIKLLADFTENTYNVKLSSNGGIYTATNKESNNVLPGGKAVAVNYTHDVASVINLASYKDKFTKKGFAFAGFATDSKGTNMIMDKNGKLMGEYQTVGKLFGLSAKNNATVTICAVWEKVVANRPIIASAGKDGSVINVTIATEDTAASVSYELQYSTNFLFRDPVNVSWESKNIKTGSIEPDKIYYIRARVVKKDSEGKDVTSPWSKAVSVK